MRFFSALTVVPLMCLLLSAVGTMAAPTSGGNGGGHGGGHGGGNGPPRRQCSTDTDVPDLAAKQKAALEDFTNILYVQRDAQTAFDTYIPGEYIQHNPFTTSGRDLALEFLKHALATLPSKFTNIRTVSSGGLGVVHAKFTIFTADGQPGSASAGVDIFRFLGTCIVEHWDVVQAIIGNEINPIAFF